MAEMKTLNGYEVVDAKAREDIESLKESGGNNPVTEKQIQEAVNAYMTANPVEGGDVSVNVRNAIGTLLLKAVFAIGDNPPDAEITEITQAKAVIENWMSGVSDNSGITQIGNLLKITDTANVTAIISGSTLSIA